MESTIQKREGIQDKEIRMTKVSYRQEMGKAYNKGRIDALIMAGKTVEEIVSLLDIKESIVRKIYNIELKNKEEQRI